MPRLRNARSSALLTAGSSAATSRGSASTMVTSAPNERITEANSTPMTPPPSTTTRAGHGIQRERTVAGHDRAADLEAGQRAGVGAGGEHDVPADEAPVADDDGAVALEAALPST